MRGLIIKKYLSLFLSLFFLGHATFLLAAPKTTILSRPEYHFQVEYPADWRSELNKKTNVIGFQDLTLLNLDQMTGSNTEMWVQVLRNNNGRTLDYFFLTKIMNSKELIPLSKKTINQLDLVLIGYRYDPLAFGIIKYEVKAMIKISNEIFIYFQLFFWGDVNDQQVTALADRIISSFRLNQEQE